MNKLFAALLVIEIAVAAILSAIPVTHNSTDNNDHPSLGISPDSPLASPILHSAVHFFGYYAIGVANVLVGGTIAGTLSALVLASETELIQYMLKPEGRSVEIKDILLNFLGASLGIISGFAVQYFFKRRY